MKYLPYLMSDEELEEIEHFASLHFHPKEIAIILGKSELSPIEAAYEKGRLKQEAEVREKIFQLAKNGSGPEIINAMKIINGLKAELKLDFPERFMDANHQIELIPDEEESI